jgi:hypothetical protein
MCAHSQQQIKSFLPSPFSIFIIRLRRQLWLPEDFFRLLALLAAHIDAFGSRKKSAQREEFIKIPSVF